MQRGCSREQGGEELVADHKGGKGGVADQGGEEGRVTARGDVYVLRGMAGGLGQQE